jgi:hypothetical protein
MRKLNYWSRMTKCMDPASLRTRRTLFFEIAGPLAICSVDYDFRSRPENYTGNDDHTKSTRRWRLARGREQQKENFHGTQSFSDCFWKCTKQIKTTLPRRNISAVGRQRRREGRVKIAVQDPYGERESCAAGKRWAAALRFRAGAVRNLRTRVSKRA